MQWWFFVFFFVFLAVAKSEQKKEENPWEKRKREKGEGRERWKLGKNLWCGVGVMRMEKREEGKC